MIGMADRDDRGLISSRSTFWMSLWTVVVIIALGFIVWRQHTREAPGFAAGGNPAGVSTVEPAPAADRGTFVSPLGGQWYPRQAAALDSMLDAFLAKAEAEPRDDVIALIVPHAGYEYSGATAAAAYKTIQGRHFSRVIVLGPSHRVAMPNAASVPDFQFLETPLGKVELDTVFIHYLKKMRPLFSTVASAHNGEHSVQIQVPFLQKVLGDFKLVPIVVGQLDMETARTMAYQLGSLMDNETLVVISTDFTHFGEGFRYVPFRADIPENLRALDMGAFDQIQAKSIEGFTDYVNDTGITICGRCPVQVLLAMLPDTSSVALARYTTSGAMMHNYMQSVSYVSAVVTGAWGKERVMLMDGKAGQLDEQDKKGLLELARKTLRYRVVNRHIPKIEDLGVALTPGMRQTMGAFVTLKKHGQLRGCIGEIIPRRPVYEAVIEQAVNAGFSDPRFPPVQEDELDDIDIEISAYASAPVPVSSYKDIELGRDGIVLEKGGRRALFLPQVATEQGWDLDTTLSHLAMKAGLGPQDWREGTQFSVFQAIVFGEATE